MDKHKGEIARFISRLPSDVGLSVLIASDEVINLCALQKLSAENRNNVANLIKETTFEGGCDSVPALRTATKEAMSKPNTIVVWLHAVQPVQLSDMQSLTNRWESVDTLKLYDLHLETGRNVVASQLETFHCTDRIPTFGNAKKDLERLGARLSGTTTMYQYRRSRVLPGSGEPKGTHASPHLARLWANGEIRRLAASDNSEDRTNAVVMAKSYQLVTPVSGAVVLETKEQYDESGLEPVSPDSVPTIVTVPEPSTWALMIIGAIVLLLARARQRKNA
jgi:hypothetical protein